MKIITALNSTRYLEMYRYDWTDGLDTFGKADDAETLRYFQLAGVSFDSEDQIAPLVSLISDMGFEDLDLVITLTESNIIQVSAYGESVCFELTEGDEINQRLMVSALVCVMPSGDNYSFESRIVEGEF